MDYKEIERKHKCPKCSFIGADVQELAMTGTGLSRLFDIQHNEYLSISCKQCGYTEIYNLHILDKRKKSYIWDILIGN